MIVFDKVKKKYPKSVGEVSAHTALNQVSFSLEKGQILGMLGPNGAGKSTCIHLIMGFIQASSGSVRVLGGLAECCQTRKTIGYLPEVTSFPQNLSCMELIYFVGRSHDMTRKNIDSSAEYWLKRLGLWSDRHRLLRNFSKGMRQRAGFVSALIHDPELLILDEPMSGLDPVGRSEVVALFQELRQQRKTMLICSHILEDIEQMVDNVLILNSGKVCYQGTVDQLCQKEQGWRVNFSDGSQQICNELQLQVLMQTKVRHIQNIEKNNENFDKAFMRVLQEKGCA